MHELTVVVPAFNERDNIEPLLTGLSDALTGIAWEVVFVDDDSSDGTSELLREIARINPNVRHLLRVGRRGLASACIEGMLTASSPFIAVMDADLQHDERILPRMLEVLRRGDADMAIGTRFAAGGSYGDFTGSRLFLSKLGSRLAELLIKTEISDPMSGFFVLRQDFFDQTVRYLSGKGFKLLIDILASAPYPPSIVEVSYHFRQRHSGTSKLEGVVLRDYILLLADKTLGRYVPVRFILFVLVGSFGVLVHLALLAVMLFVVEQQFYYAQAVATLGAMTVNFFLNNLLTYRDHRLQGRHVLKGLLSFYAVCGLGAFVNLQVAESVYVLGAPWALAGTIGAGVSAVWNYAVTKTFTWRTGTGPSVSAKRPRHSTQQEAGSADARVPTTPSSSNRPVLLDQTVVDR